MNWDPRGWRPSDEGQPPAFRANELLHCAAARIHIEFSQTNIFPPKTLLCFFVVTTCLSLPALASPQPQGASPPQTQLPSQQKPVSLGDASRAAKAQRSKSAPAKVYTNNDLSGLPRRDVSVVGQLAPPAAASSGPSNVGAAKSPVKDEKYWRERSHALHAQLDYVQQSITKLENDAATYWTTGYDIRDDYELPHLWDLTAEKEDLLKQIDQLEEEARKAGADPGWLR